MKRVFGSVVLLALVGSSFAQGLGKASFRAGYFFGDSFTGLSGARLRFEGFQFGADLPLVQLPANLVTVSLSPTVIFAGAQRKGTDSDATIVRLNATAKAGIPLTGFYGVAGTGVSWAKGRGGTQVNSDLKWGAQLGAGFDFGVPLAPMRPFVQASYHFGSNESRGFAVEAGVRF